MKMCEDQHQNSIEELSSVTDRLVEGDRAGGQNES